MQEPYSHDGFDDKGVVLVSEETVAQVRQLEAQGESSLTIFVVKMVDLKEG